MFGCDLAKRPLPAGSVLAGCSGHETTDGDLPEPSMSQAATLAYSYRSASIGRSRAARLAG